MLHHYQKRGRLVSFLLSLAIALLFIPTVAAAGPSGVKIVVDGHSAAPLEGARAVGTNIEMSMTSDKMWAANGQWMAETLRSGGVNMMRWGYDAWAFDWEKEVPLSPNRYWGGLNSKDAEGTLGLREFISFCKENDVTPFVMIPIESLDLFGGEASLDRVKELTASMAAYINQEGIEVCYFDMGNEPWNNGANGLSHAKTLGGLFPEFQELVQSANPNYRLVLQRAPQNILWNTWNSTLINAANGCFDAYDDHRYSFYGWDKYFDKDSDELLIPGSRIEGKEAILGECNIGWTPRQDNWDAGHVRDLGGGMALLNAMLDQVNRGEYSYIVSWPSHYPSKASIVGTPNNSFGWFDLDEWYLNQKTVRLTGPILAHRILNQNVLENRLNSNSSGEKVRTFAYENDGQTDLRLIVINKWDQTTLTIQIPTGYNTVGATVMRGKSVWDTTPVYTNLFSGNDSVRNGVYESSIPGECVVVYSFTRDESATAPQAFSLLSPADGGTGVSTAKGFQWQKSPDAVNYRLTVSPNSDLSDPIIDLYTGKASVYTVAEDVDLSGADKVTADTEKIASYQASLDLAENTRYYWSVRADNRAGETTASGGIRSFTTAKNEKVAETATFNNDSGYISHSANWNVQASEGSYRNDDMSCKEKDGYAEFIFTGCRAKIYGIKGDWCGLADVAVDFADSIRIDTYSAVTEAQALLYDTGELPYGEHTVTLTVTGEKSAASTDTWIEYDKVELFGNGETSPVVEAIVWNDDNSNISRFSSWKHQAVSSCYHSDDTSSATWYAHMQFSFTGTNAVIYGLKGSWCGKADITVDGKKVAAIDAYAPDTEYQAVLYDTGELSPGTHTVRMTVTGTKNVASSGKWIEFDRVRWH